MKSYLGEEIPSRLQKRYENNNRLQGKIYRGFNIEGEYALLTRKI